MNLWRWQAGVNYHVYGKIWGRRFGRRLKIYEWRKNRWRLRVNPLREPRLP